MALRIAVVYLSGYLDPNIMTMNAHIVVLSGRHQSGQVYDPLTPQLPLIFIELPIEELPKPSEILILIFEF